LSKAELATAMPRAGGTYFYLDRSFGPLVGTVGGLGTWVAMVLKTAFAFVGIGVYLALLVELPSTSLSLILVLAFLGLNLVGAKEASLVQRLLVAALVGILALFVGQGLWLGVRGAAPAVEPSPFLRDGTAGLLSTIGLVFVSYAGLTKVASVAEEVADPERNIPLGMGLSLVTSMLLYSLGAYVLISVIEPLRLAKPDLTPVASAAEVVFAWMPGRLGVLLIVVAAIGAFASTGNAALFSASRYLLALGRDRRVPEGLARVSSGGVPSLALLASAAAVVAALLTLDVASVAKLASAFQLMIFSLVNLALIVMRESEIESYDPGFRSPLYPWVQIVGFAAPPMIIAELGHLAITFSFGLVACGVAYYFLFARRPEAASGAIYHVLARAVRLHSEAMERLSTSLDEGTTEELDLELRAIIGERGLRAQDPYDEVVARAFTIDVAAPAEGYGELAREAARLVAERIEGDAEALAAGLLARAPNGALLAERGVALHHLRLRNLARPELVLARCREGLSLTVPEAVGSDERCHACFFLFSPEHDPGQHLRLLAHLALQSERTGFRREWLAAASADELHETLLRTSPCLSLRLAPDHELVGRPVRELELPQSTLIAAVRREGEVFFPRGESLLQAGDRVTVLGPSEDLDALRERWRSSSEPARRG
ncbi:MAG TPA: hypothetical protein DEA08_07145, partial [Planctomycetes bacterium]|nr:hypothetical protein [Planctomycetota bacterium]